MGYLIFWIATFLAGSTSQSSCERVPYSYFVSLDEPAMATVQVILTPTIDQFDGFPNTLYFVCVDDSLAIYDLLACGSNWDTDDYFPFMPRLNPRMVRVSSVQLKTIIDRAGKLEEVTDGVDECLELHVVLDSLGRWDHVEGNGKPDCVVEFQMLDRNGPRYFKSTLSPVTVHTLLGQVLSTLDPESPARDLVRRFGAW